MPLGQVVLDKPEADEYTIRVTGKRLHPSTASKQRFSVVVRAPERSVDASRTHTHPRIPEPFLWNWSTVDRNRGSSA